MIQIKIFVGVRDRQCDLFQSCYIFVAPVVASYMLDELDIVSVVALVCGQSRECRVCRRVPRRVPNRARAGVF